MAPRRAPRRVFSAAGALLGACLASRTGAASAADGLPMPGKPFTTTLSGDGGPTVGETYVGTPGTSTLYMNSLAAVDPEAVCNDGSPAAYFMASGSGQGSNMWLVFLEGSMFCWDADSCNERYEDHQYWMSSTKWAPEMAQGGIFATDGSSAWGTANRIYIKYCSSDFWSGDVAASDATFGYAFRGARIVAATITDLLENKGMGSQPDAQLLFGGCSAGAIGAMNNMDAVAAQLPPTVAVKGFLDAAALLNIQPTGWEWSSQLETLQSLIVQVAANINPVFPSYCAENFPGKEWMCLIGQYRMPLIRSMPFFINAPQFDEFELMYDTDNFAPATPAQYAFVNEFQTGTRALIASLPAGTGVFSPTCLVHCLSGQTTYSQLIVAGSSFSAAVNKWYFDNQPVQVVSQCNGWQCINQCGIFSDGSVGAGLPCNMGDQNCVPVQLATDVNGVVTEPQGSTGGQQTSEWAATAVSVAATPSAAPAVQPQTLLTQQSVQTKPKPATQTRAQAAAQQQAQKTAAQQQAAAQAAALQGVPAAQLQTMEAQAQAQAQTLAAQEQACMQQCQLQQVAAQAQLCANQCTGQYQMLMAQINPGLLGTSQVQPVTTQQPAGQPAPAPQQQPQQQPLPQQPQPQVQQSETEAPSPEPGQVSATEESLSEEQKALMQRLTSLSTMRRLYSAAPACCNGRSTFD